MNGKQNSPANGQESSGTANELHTDRGVSRRRFLGAAAAATLPAASSPAAADGDSDTEQDDEIVETPDLSNDYPNIRHLKGGTGHALTGIWFPEQWRSSTQAETEDFGGITELQLYQHALQWGMGISIKIRKGDVETAISLDVDRAELLGRWLIEAARDTKRWRAENPEGWEHTMKRGTNIAARIDDPAVSEGELGTDRLKTSAELAAEVDDADQ